QFTHDVIQVDRTSLQASLLISDSSLSYQTSTGVVPLIQSPGAQSFNISLYGNVTSTPGAGLTVSVNGQSVSSDTMINLGSVAPGSSAQKQITITNATGASIVLSDVSFTILTFPQHGLSASGLPAANAVIAAGQSKAFTVTLSP